MKKEKQLKQEPKKKETKLRPTRQLVAKFLETNHIGISYTDIVRDSFSRFHGCDIDMRDRSHYKRFPDMSYYDPETGDTMLSWGKSNFTIPVTFRPSIEFSRNLANHFYEDFIPERKTIRYSGDDILAVYDSNGDLEFQFEVNDIKSVKIIVSTDNDDASYFEYLATNYVNSHMSLEAYLMFMMPRIQEDIDSMVSFDIYFKVVGQFAPIHFRIDKCGCISDDLYAFIGPMMMFRAKSESGCLLSWWRLSNKTIANSASKLCLDILTHKDEFLKIVESCVPEYTIKN